MGILARQGARKALGSAIEVRTPRTGGRKNCGQNDAEKGKTSRRGYFVYCRRVLCIEHLGRSPLRAVCITAQRPARGRVSSQSASNRSPRMLGKQRLPFPFRKLHYETALRSFAAAWQFRQRVWAPTTEKCPDSSAAATTRNGAEK